MLKGLSSSIREKLPRARPTGGCPVPQLGCVPSGLATHPPTPSPCPPLLTSASQMGVGPTLLLPSCPGDDMPLKSLYWIPGSSAPSTKSVSPLSIFHKWHHFTYYTRLIRLFTGHKRASCHLTFLRLSGWIFFLTIMSTEQLSFCFCKLLMFVAHVFPMKLNYFKIIFNLLF